MYCISTQTLVQFNGEVVTRIVKANIFTISPSRLMSAGASPASTQRRSSGTECGGSIRDGCMTGSSAVSQHTDKAAQQTELRQLGI